MMTYQMKYCVDDFPIRHLFNLDKSNQHGKFQAVIHRHRNNFLGSLDVTKRRTVQVRHCESLCIDTFKHFKTQCLLVF